MIFNLSAKYLRMTCQYLKILRTQNFYKSEQELNEDVTIIKKGAFQWKTDFKPDLTRQAIEICFSHKIVSNNPKPLSFNQ